MHNLLRVSERGEVVLASGLGGVCRRDWCSFSLEVPQALRAKYKTLPDALADVVRNERRHPDKLDALARGLCVRIGEELSLLSAPKYGHSEAYTNQDAEVRARLQTLFDLAFCAKPLTASMINGERNKGLCWLLSLVHSRLVLRKPLPRRVVIDPDDDLVLAALRFVLAAERANIGATYRLLKPESVAPILEGSRGKEARRMLRRARRSDLLAKPKPILSLAEIRQSVPESFRLESLSDLIKKHSLRKTGT